MVSWALAPVLIRYLSGAYEPYGQNLVRYGSATVILIIVSALFYREDLLKVLRNPYAVLGLAALNLLQQTTWTYGCYGTPATIAQLMGKLSVVFVFILAFVFFREERAVIRSPLFLGGTAVSLLGVVGILEVRWEQLIPNVDLPMLLLWITAVLWAGYTVWARHLVLDVHPIPMFTVLSIFTTAGFGALTFTVGDPAMIPAAGWRLTAVAFLSGLISIALAHTAFHYAQKRLGSALSSAFNLLTPLATFSFAWFILPDETLSVYQMLGAAMLLTGTAVISLTAYRSGAQERGAKQAVDIPCE